MENLRNQLEEALEKAYNDLSLYEPGTKEHEAALKAVDVLTKLQISEYNAEEAAVKNEMDLEFAREKLEQEQKIAREKLHEEKLQNKREGVLRKQATRSNIIAAGASIASTVAGIVVFKKAVNGIIEYEEENVITTKAFSLLPKITSLFFRK